ncbi:MAG TPA: leucyl aminopeptidase [Actinobacteria bacterium]|nr:putative cytosol aminopeptidase [bacterium BMS3Bbin02]HDL41503.1 leucyl aminopeptidase [Actinomycetota bacterium]
MITVSSGEALLDESGDAFVVPVFADLTWGPGTAEIAEQLGDWLEGELAAQKFTGKAGKTATVPGVGTNYGRIVFVGLGDEADTESLRQAAGCAANATSQSERVVTTLHTVDIDGATSAVILGFMLGAYSFTERKSEPEASVTAELVLAGGAQEDEISRGEILAGAVSFARDMVNEPANHKRPSVLADRFRAVTEPHGVTVTVYDEAGIVDERFGGLAAVAQGATNPPRMVVMKYSPEGATKTVALVGKGIVFDSGGLSIKSAAGMETMKTDMSGAAAVAGAVSAIARLGLKVNILGITPLTENMTGGAAQRPGDVFTARNGSTVEVLNTDAEGRLVLADGLALAAEANPDIVVDVATLTGACMVALGKDIAGVWASDDEVAATITSSASAAGEKFWHMPLEQDYRTLLDSDIADIKNTAGRWGGAITAALFLHHFVGDQPWAHLDIAGPARAEKARHYIKKGGTGFGVRTMVAIAQAHTAE